MSWWTSPNSKHAFLLACSSMISTSSAAVAGLTLYWASKSPLCLVYGLENVVDLISDMVVVWRFYCPADLTAEVEERLNQRETRAGIAISTVLGLLGVDIIITAIHNLTRGSEKLEEGEMIIIVSSISFVVFGILTVFKMRYSYLLESPSLRKDAICSLIGTILSLCLFINVFLFRYFPAAWWFDPTVALICGIAALAIGSHAIIDARFSQKLPIFQPSWWLMKKRNDSGNDDEENASSADSKEANNESGEELSSTQQSSTPSAEAK